MMLFRLPRAVCAAVLAFTSELVPARELPLHDFDVAGLEPTRADFDDEPNGPLIEELKMLKAEARRLAAQTCTSPVAAAVPPAAVCCSDGGVTPTVPPSEPAKFTLNSLRQAFIDALGDHRPYAYQGRMDGYYWCIGSDGVSRHNLRDTGCGDGDWQDWREHAWSMFRDHCEMADESTRDADARIADRLERVGYEHTPEYFDTDRNK